MQSSLCKEDHHHDNDSIEGGCTRENMHIVPGWSTALAYRRLEGTPDSTLTKKVSGDAYVFI